MVHQRFDQGLCIPCLFRHPLKVRAEYPGAVTERQGNPVDTVVDKVRFQLPVILKIGL